MTSHPLDSNEERAALDNSFQDICENKDSFMGMLEDLNRFAPRPPEGHLALDLYFVMEIQLEKHSSYGLAFICCWMDVLSTVGLMLEHGTFHFCPALIPYFRLCIITGPETKRTLPAVHSSMNAFRKINHPQTDSTNPHLSPNPHPHPGGNAGTCYSVHPVASPELVLAL